MSAVAVLGILAIACSSTPSRQGLEPSSSPTSGSSPSTEPTSDIQFLLQDAYPVGTRVVVRIKNVGDETYRYEPYFQACFLSYSDSAGREFTIPPGTHCDMLRPTPIRPGETRRLFTWNLDECTNDDWGCLASRPLEPGTYTIEGVFTALDDGARARARATFEIVATS
jgi:hypothetical protein